MAVDEKSVKVSENAITYNGETIPVDAEHKDEIEALLKAIEENHKKKTDEMTATIRTKDHLIISKEEMVNRMEKELIFGLKKGRKINIKLH